MWSVKSTSRLKVGVISEPVRPDLPVSSEFYAGQSNLVRKIYPQYIRRAWVCSRFGEFSGSESTNLPCSPGPEGISFFQANPTWNSQFSNTFHLTLSRRRNSITDNEIQTNVSYCCHRVVTPQVHVSFGKFITRTHIHTWGYMYCIFKICVSCNLLLDIFRRIVIFRQIAPLFFACDVTCKFHASLLPSILKLVWIREHLNYWNSWYPIL